MLESDSDALPRRWRGYWKEGCLGLGVLSIVLIIALIAVSSERKVDYTHNKENHACPVNNEKIDLTVSDNPPVFSDLTEVELTNVRDYMLSQPDLNIVSISQAIVTSSYIYSIELFLPEKADILQHLDLDRSQPSRYAKVIVFRGDLPNPVIQEYKVGPLPNPQTHNLIDYGEKRKNPIPFAYRPLTFMDVQLINAFIFPEIVRKSEKILEKSFDGKLAACGKKCLTYDAGPVSTSHFGIVVRKFWIGLYYAVEFLTLHPLDYQVLVNLDGVNTSNYRIEKVWFNQRLFNTLDELKSAFESNQLNIVQVKFPEVNEKLFSTLNLRGEPFPRKPLGMPYQVEPDGKRYSIQGQYVEYMDWSFNYRMSTSTGPMLFDVRFRKQRIVYELSLQEIAVFYSGYGPSGRFSDIVDSASMIGVLSKVLVPGSDCPDHATFLPARHFTEASNTPTIFQNALCLFEQSTGNPLRRHHSFSAYSGHFYEGLMDNVLTLRAILTVGNYDYIFDYTFHQNGGLEVKVMATGYILASFYSSNENKFGFQIHENLLGNIHHHMFHFKVDIDIFGTANRFESLDIGVDKTDNGEFSNLKNDFVYHQLKVTRNIKRNEKEAVYNFNFNKPKYLTFYNEKRKTRQGLPKAYRVVVDGVSKQLLPADEGHEPSISWARQQLAVTKYKESERHSSSIYAIWDAVDPVNDFHSFIEDSENIIDEDLVSWITMGVHHIPHTEDLPVTPTVGGHLEFFLLPYNYFEEDPAMSSRDAIRYDIGEDQTIQVHRNGMEQSNKCLPKTSNFDELIKNKPKMMFD